MKAKRIVLLSALLCVIVVFVVLSSTVFSLKQVEFCFLKTPLHYSTSHSEQIIESGKFNYGQSIFLVNKQDHINKIEKEFPYIKVVGIESIFPNILLIQSVEREQLYGFLNKTQTQLAICDGDCKVLRVVEVKDGVVSEEIPIVNCGQSFEKFEVGDFLQFAHLDIFKSLATAFQESNYSNAEIARMFKTISIVEKENYETILRINSYNKYRILIYEPTKYLSEKFGGAKQALFGEKGVGEDFSGIVQVIVKNNTLYVNTIKE